MHTMQLVGGGGLHTALGFVHGNTACTSLQVHRHIHIRSNNRTMERAMRAPTYIPTLPPYPPSTPITTPPPSLVHTHNNSSTRSAASSCGRSTAWSTCPRPSARATPSPTGGGRCVRACVRRWGAAGLIVVRVDP